mgnify:CR=1 FL=1
MKTKKFTPAHESENFGELVCSNSLKSNDFYIIGYILNTARKLTEETQRFIDLLVESAKNI